MNASRKKTEEPPEKRDVKEVRMEVRSYIRNERDTVMKKWMALKETLKSEDSRRNQFLDRRLREDTKSLPLNVMKFIGTLKKSVRHTMRYKGGTPYSIVRGLFLYWDADKSGKMSAAETFSVMKSLGAKVSLEECAEIVKYYSNNDATGEMDYKVFLQDLQTGEPTIISFVTKQEDEERDNNELRFEEVNDKFVKMPPTVLKFLEAVRTFLARKMRNEGGTPFQHIRQLFNFYDYDYSGGLLPSELATACRKKMLLSITLDQAKEIVDYYDRKSVGEMGIERFLDDVCVDVKPILTFTELTPARIEAEKNSLQENPFIPKPFAAPTNKVLEKFKQDIKAVLVNKINKLGGSVSSWIREAFVYWDPGYTRKISKWDHLQGAAKRLGITITDDEAKVLIACYDRYHTGEMHYQFLADEIMKEDPNFLMDGKVVDKNFTPTTRCPPQVTNLLNQVKKAADAFAMKSSGRLQARDILRGTCARFDPTHTGKIDISSFRNVAKELRVTTTLVKDADYSLMMKWFDTNGSHTVDYNALIIQLYGSDVSTEALQLPKLKESNSLSHILTKTFGPSDEKIMTRITSDSDFGLPVNILERNVQVIESQAVKLARFRSKKMKIISERVKIEKKIASIEEQKKRIVEDYKARQVK
jgi:Ca2+-binding EF-hand superfamily protein